ncbi:major facilitator superfamily transporter [Nitratireductor aquibiodomus RA22]|uniref:Major facilitator superfamily transporter n=1 Tax=Nitratireductor aquibiodomus RA22 TaxID=1189611 RepID=I5BVC8_9HYPH|nr:MFS transporter [Nitratireductor aquibiodomus]EIM73530.1 major facilitator superfamily transporter [Nitratireductor aquibiodomus RA22]
MVTGARLVSVFCINMVQGLPASFFAIGLPALLRETGAGLDMVALAYLVWAPWALKWLWGPYLDGRPSFFNAVFGRVAYLPFIMAGVFAVLAFFPPSVSVGSVLAIGVVCSFVGATLQMVLARWIMAVEQDEKQRARLNAAQVAGMISGAMTGGTLIVALSELLSWTVAITAIVALIVIASLPFLLTQRETTAPPLPLETEEKQTASGIVRALRQFFSRPGVGLLAGLMLMSDIATGVDVLLAAHLVDNGYSATRATFLLNTLALAITVPATFVTARYLERFPVHRVLCALLFIKASIFLLLGSGLVSSAYASAALAIAAVVLASVIAIAYWQIYMRFAAPGHAASDIGIMTSLRTLFLMAGGIGAGQVAGTIGYEGIFWLAAIMAFAASLLAIMQGRKAHGAVTP